MARRKMRESTNNVHDVGAGVTLIGMRSSPASGCMALSPVPQTVVFRRPQ